MSIFPIFFRFIKTYVFSFLQNRGHNIHTIYNLCYLPNALKAKKLVVLMMSRKDKIPLHFLNHQEQICLM